MEMSAGFEKTLKDLGKRLHLSLMDLTVEEKLRAIKKFHKTVDKDSFEGITSGLAISAIEKLIRENETIKVQVEAHYTAVGVTGFRIYSHKEKRLLTSEEVSWLSLRIDNEKWSARESGGELVCNYQDSILIPLAGIKDKQLKEIAEGDILQDEAGNKVRVFRVPGGLAINRHFTDYNKRSVFFYTAIADMQIASYIKSCTIISNIYEHPEILID